MYLLVTRCKWVNTITTFIRVITLVNRQLTYRFKDFLTKWTINWSIIFKTVTCILHWKPLVHHKTNIVFYLNIQQMISDSIFRNTCQVWILMKYKYTLSMNQFNRNPSVISNKTVWWRKPSQEISLEKNK